MEDLKKMYQAIEMLEQLGLPVSLEQKQALRRMENDYLEQNIIPSLEELIKSEVEDLKYGFHLLVTYQPEEGLSIKQIEKKTVAPASSDIDNQDRKVRNYIRVTYPDGKVTEDNKVWKTLVAVIEYAGPARVEALNIMCGPLNIIQNDPNAFGKFSSPKELSTGQYVDAYSDTKTKFRHLNEINSRLQLGLKLEQITL